MIPASRRSVRWPNGQRAPGHGREEPIDGHRADPRRGRGHRGAGGSPVVRRRRMGSIRTDTGAGTCLVRADLLQVVPDRVGGTREDPDRGRRAARGQPRRGHPLGRSGHHARDREGAGAPGLRDGRLLLPHGAGRRDPLGPRRRGVRPPRQRLPPAEGAAAARPRVPRRDQGPVQVLHRPLPAAPLRTGRLRRDRHAGRCARRPDRGGGLRGGDARAVATARRSPRLWASPTSRSRPTSSPSGRSGW